jgi:hypothetical protein
MVARAEPFSLDWAFAGGGPVDRGVDILFPAFIADVVGEQACTQL